jgi:hypothetical protein
MTARKTNRRRFADYASLVILAVLLFRTPAVQRIVTDALIEFVEVTERAFRFPCALLDHDRCFSLDRLDPTCPQCF